MKKNSLSRLCPDVEASSQLINFSARKKKFGWKLVATGDIYRVNYSCRK